MSNKQAVAILCGGASFEHEVSVISGIQIAQHIDRSKYTPYFVYFDKTNESFLVQDMSTDKKDFLRNKRVPIDLVKRSTGLTITTRSLIKREIPISLVFMAFHGGTGESGPMQGLIEYCNTPFTAATQEGAVLAMNKAITKEVLVQHAVPVLPWISILSSEYKYDAQAVCKRILNTLPLPLIIKPVHLGSSIGITFAHTETELQQQLAVACRMDTEILIEPALTDFTEYNIAVRSHKGELQFSPIEEPVRDGEMLSFDDKYANGSKKGGGKGVTGGMELLDRTVPAEISDELAAEIKQQATNVYRACRLSGMLRIDFMYSDGKLYCTEPNPIPGSLAFYLWEAAGESFQEQITQALEDAVWRHTQKIAIEPHETDIVEKFVG